MVLRGTSPKASGAANHDHDQTKRKVDLNDAGDKAMAVSALSARRDCAS